MLLASTLVQAVDCTWNADASGFWNTAADPPWAGGVVPGLPAGIGNSDTATFGFPLTEDRTVTVDAARNLTSITFSNPGNRRYTLSGGSLVLSVGGFIQTGAGNGEHTDTVDSPVVLQDEAFGSASFVANATSVASLLNVGAVTGAATESYVTTLTLDGSNPGSNTITGTIGDGVGLGKLALSKIGIGKWVLAGANTFSGGVAVNAGVLVYANTAAKPGSGGTTVLSSGTLGLGVGGPGYFSAANIGELFANTLANVTIATSATVGIDTSAGDFTYASAIPSTSRGLTKLGANTLTLASANGHTGLTTVAGGALRLGAAGSGATSPLGTVASGTSVNAGAALDLNGFTLATAEGLTLNGSGVANGGALTNSAATAASYSGLLKLGSASSIVASGGNLTLSNAGTITGAGFDLTLGGAATGSLAGIIGTVGGGVTKTGTGTWMLSGVSTYTGPVLISGGTLKLGATGSGANSPLGTIDADTTVNSGAALDLNGVTLATAEALTLNGTGIAGGGALTNSSSTTSTYKGPILLGSASSIVASSGSIILSNAVTGSGIGLTLDGSASLSKITGNLATGAGGLTKAGTGIWELAGTNTYSGPTVVTAGMLKIAKPASLYNAVESSWTPANITVAGGATLRLYCGGPSDFTGTQAGTLLANLTTVNNNGLLADAFLGLDTFNAVGLITTVSAVIRDSSGPGGGAVGLKKFSGGTVLLSAANTYTGKTFIDSGSLKVATLNSVATQAGLGTVHSSSSSLGAPVTVAAGTIDFGSAGSGTAAGLIYTGTGETTDRVMNIPAKNGNITFDQSGTGLLKLVSPLTLTGSGNLTVTLQGSTAGSGEIVGALVNPVGFTTSLTKAGTGTWTLSGVNSYTGNTAVSGGTLVLADNAQLKFVIGATSGTTNSVTGAGAVVLSGDFAIDTSAAAALTSGSWTLVNAATLTESFTASFNVIGFTPNGDGISWIRSDSGKTWLFDESTGTLTLSSGGSDYDTWMAGYPTIISPADKLPTADPDHDGRTNQQEYAFGLDPSSGASVSPIVVPLNTITGTFSYTRRATPATTGLGYTIQTSTTLAAAGWTTDAAATQAVISTVSGVQTVQVTLSAAKPMTAPRFFVRVLAQ